MVYHVPTMLAKYGNLKQFSGQGILGLIITHSGLILVLLQVLRKTMTPSVTTFLVINMMPQERLFGVNPTRKH